MHAMQKTERALVVGGTRGTGILIANLLLAGGYNVRELARRPPQATGRLEYSVDVVPGDVTKPETISSAVKEISHLIFTAGVAPGPPREKLNLATEDPGDLDHLN